MKLICKLMALILLAGCSDIPEVAPDDASLEVSLGVSTQMASRTTLTSEEATHNITSVQLLIFNGTDEKAKLIYTSNPIIDLTDLTDLAKTPDAPGKRVSLQHVGLAPHTTYTLLAVGLDEESKNTYTLNAPTLGEALLSLNAPTAASAMRTCEPFAGSTTFTTNAAGGSYGAKAVMRRRVAGILGTFTNLPATVDGTAVARLVLKLYSPLNTQVPLLRNPQADYITSPASGDDNNIIFSLTANGSASAYMLPVAEPTDENTMRLCLLDGSGKELRSWKVVLSTSHYIDDNVTINAPRTSFAIEANQIYDFGTVDLSDTPADGVITVHGAWQYNVDIEFE